MNRCAAVAGLLFPAAVLTIFASAWQAQACEDYWTAAYKCMQGCGPCGGGPGPSPPPIDHERQRLNDLTLRFTDQLKALQKYEIPGIDELYSAPAPTTLYELGARVDSAYVEAEFYRSTKRWNFDSNERSLAEWTARIPTLRAEIQRFQSNIGSGPLRIAEAESLRDAAKATAELAELDAFALRGNTTALRDDLVLARTGALSALLALLPADQKDAFSEAMKRGETIEAYAVQDPSTPPEVAKPIPAPPEVARGVATSLFPSTQKPQPINGSLDDKIAAFDGVNADLERLVPYVAWQEQQLPGLSREVADLTAQHNALGDENWTLDSRLREAGVQTAKLTERLRNAHGAEEVSAGNALRLASATIVWEHLRDTVVVPQIKAILEANGLANGVEGLEMLNRIRESPQDFLPKVGPFKDLPRLIETAKKVVSVEENMQSYALAAAEANAQVGTAEAESLAAHLFAGLSKEGIEIMRTASDAVDGPQGKIVQLLMERAPKEE